MSSKCYQYVIKDKPIMQFYPDKFARFLNDVDVTLNHEYAQQIIIYGP